MNNDLIFLKNSAANIAKAIEMTFLQPRIENKCSVCGSPTAKENFIPEMGMCRGCRADKIQDEEFRYGEQRA